MSAARQQARDDVKIYGINGDAQAMAAIKGGHMTATAWGGQLPRGQEPGRGPRQGRTWVAEGQTPGRATVEAKLAGPQYAVEIAAVAAR